MGNRGPVPFGYLSMRICCALEVLLLAYIFFDKVI